MPDTGPEQRRLAAIMFTDMVGYTALAQRNEALALELLEEHRRLLRPLFVRHGGHEVKTIGDGFLVEFASALDASRCAIEIQKALVEHNASAARERAIHVRIGIHLGDVVYREADLFGDEVNVASRIEPLAEPGGICLSRPVFDQVRNKLDLPLAPLGRAALKNVAVPIEVYRVVLPWAKGNGRATPPPSEMTRRMRWRAMVTALAIALAAAGAGWWARQHAGAGRDAVPPAPTADGRRSVAVLPFTNMSPDREDEYLSDGMTEEIIGALAKVKGLQVAARTSSFTFKGRNEEIETIGRQLHVGSVLEGSVTRVGTKLRVSAQLIDVADGYHRWSDTYDRDMADIFAIRSDVAQRVSEALEVELGVGTRQRLEQKPTENLAAYDLYLKGRYQATKYSADGLRKAAEYFRQAIAVDPSYARAYDGLAYYYVTALDWLLPPREAMAGAREAATKALALDDTLAEPHVWLATVHYFYEWDWAAAEREFERAIELEPGSATAHAYYGQYLAFGGRTEAGLVQARRALELDPLSLETNAFYAGAFFFAHRYDEAIEQCRRIVDMDPSYWLAHLWLGLAYAMQGKLDRALAETARAKELEPTIAEGTSALGVVQAMAGRADEARKIIAELEERSARQHVPAYNIAVIYAALGENDRAFEWLDRAADERSFYMLELKTDPQLDRLRPDPRFAALLAKVGLEK